MENSAATSEQQLVRELVARFAGQFPESALTDLAGRLLRSEQRRARWDVLLGEVVACAVYNQVSLEQAETLIMQSAEQD